MRKHILTFTTLAAGLAAGALAMPALAADGGMLEVTGVSSIHHLNVRESGSLSAKVLGGVSNGAVLKNLGCKDGAEGQWCNVETDKGLKGWSFGKYLKGDKAAAMAPKKIPAFALGKLKCERNNGSPVTDCDYGVMRFGAGMVKLQVIWPDTSRRTFGLFGTTATSKEGPVTVKMGSGGSYEITITPAGAASEHYSVPADVISG